MSAISRLSSQRESVGERRDVRPIAIGLPASGRPASAGRMAGRDLAAWIGLVPRQNSSGGKERLGGISRAGNRYLRQMLVVGAMAVIRHAERHGTKRAWLIELMKRRAKKVAAVALANKTVRMVWADDERRTLSRASCGARIGDQAPRPVSANDVGKGGQELMHKAG